MTEVLLRVFIIERKGQRYKVQALTQREAENRVAEGEGRLLTCDN